MARNKGVNVAASFGLNTNKMSRSYMMTIWFDRNSQTFEGIVEKMQTLFDGGFIRYSCLSQEVCPDTGRLHGHLFTRFVDSWSGVKAFSAYGIESGGGWFEEAIKDFPSFEYVSCSGHFAEGQPKGKPKPLRFFEIGDRPKSEPLSKKKDFSACFAMLQGGASLMEVCAAYPEIALKGFTNLQRLYLLIREEEGKKRIDRNIAENEKRDKDVKFFSYGKK